MMGHQMGRPRVGRRRKTKKENKRHAEMVDTTTKALVNTEKSEKKEKK